MAFTISKAEHRQQYLAGLLVVLVLIALYVWKGKDLLVGQSAQVITPQFQSKNVNIDFDFLEKPIFDELRTFEEIQPFEGEVGQTNPFVAK